MQLPVGGAWAQLKRGLRGSGVRERAHSAKAEHPVVERRAPGGLRWLASPRAVARPAHMSVTVGLHADAHEAGTGCAEACFQASAQRAGQVVGRGVRIAEPQDAHWGLAFAL